MALAMTQMNVNSETLTCSVNDYVFDISMYSTEEIENNQMRLAIVSINPKETNLLTKVRSAIFSDLNAKIIVYNNGVKLVEAIGCELEYMNMSKDEGFSFSATFLYDKIR